jgi:hypothetical protein
VRNMTDKSVSGKYSAFLSTPHNKTFQNDAGDRRCKNRTALVRPGASELGRSGDAARPLNGAAVALSWFARRTAPPEPAD